MRILKRHPLLKPATDFVIDSPTPSNISYWWNVGSLLGLSLVLQIITGITLAMHYNSSIAQAFNSVEHIMRDVSNGWFIRYLHSNAASAFFFLVYLHIGKGLYYGSYKAPRTLVWTIGTVIFILMMATAFLGYVLPYGQMSLWGATVITNLMSAIPWLGLNIVEFIWGGFSVNNATLNRFFSLHFVLPFALAALVIIHLLSLHDSAGSGNPTGVSSNSDKISFSPYFIFKDIITVFIFMWVLGLFVLFAPNVLGDSENYVMANPMQTPPAIVPEWYLLPFYAVLRSIPNKLVGVIAMFSAILIVLALSFSDIAKLRGMQFKPLGKTVFFVFSGILLFLMVLGAEHVESPYLEFGQIGTVFYFGYYLVPMPFNNFIEQSIKTVQVGIKNISGNLLNNLINLLNNAKIAPLAFNGLPLQSSYIQPIKCPCCGAKGDTVWVVPGERCGFCGTLCKTISALLPIILLTTLMSLITLAVSFGIIHSNSNSDFILLCDAVKPWGANIQNSLSLNIFDFVQFDVIKPLGNMFVNIKNVAGYLINNILINLNNAKTTPHAFNCLPLQSTYTPVKCPCCGAKGDTVWVIPGKLCGFCGTLCKTISVTTWIIFISSMLVVSYLAVSTGTISSDFTHDFILLCDVPRS